MVFFGRFVHFAKPKHLDKHSKTVYKRTIPTSSPLKVILQTILTISKKIFGQVRTTTLEATFSFQFSHKKYIMKERKKKFLHQCPFFPYQRSPFTLKQTLNTKKSIKFIEKKFYHHIIIIFISIPTSNAPVHRRMIKARQRTPKTMFCNKFKVQILR